MASWLILAVAAQFFGALVALLDKYIVTNERALPRPFVYAFATCLFSGASILVFLLSSIPIPLPEVDFPSFANVEPPSLTVLAFSFLAAYTFFGALVSMFTALRTSDASDVVPVVGAVSALSTFAFGYFFLGASLTPNFLAGVLLLAVGTFFVSHLRFTWKTALLTIHAGIFFAFHYVTFKGLLSVTSFDNAFFWSRIGFVGFALTLLLIPEYFEKIMKQTASTGKRGGALVIFNKVLAGIASILILKATALGDAAVVQALGGLQFVFILILGLLFSSRMHKDLGEKHTTVMEVVHKAVFVSIITLGFFVLFR